MNRKVMSESVRNGFRRFVRGTRGRVAMEYVVLGVYVAALTVVAAMVIGIVFSQRINTISEITTGNTKEAVRGDKFFKGNGYPGTLGEYLEYSEYYQRDVIGNSNQAHTDLGHSKDLKLKFGD